MLEHKLPGDLDMSNKEVVTRYFGNAIARYCDTVAEDILVNENGQPDESVSLSRDDIFDIVLDLFIGRLPDGDVKTLWWLWTETDRTFKDAVKMAAFPYEIYGW